MEGSEIMKWEEFLRSNDKVEGRKVFIVDVRLSDGNAYLRNVPPTEVMITSNSELPKNKRVYYSNYHFRKLNKKGEPLKQIIAPFDNTGYRSYTGVSVHVFETYEEATEKFNEQLDDIINQYEDRKAELDSCIVKTRMLKL